MSEPIAGSEIESVMLTDYPFRAMYDEGYALRRALAEYIQEHIQWANPDGSYKPIQALSDPAETAEVAEYPRIVLDYSDAEFASSSNTPVKLKETAWPEGEPRYMLVQDATYTETFDLIVRGTDPEMISGILLALTPLMSPHAAKYGSLLLGLGDYYFGRTARYTPLGVKRGSEFAGDDLKSRVLTARMQVAAEVDRVKVVSVVPRLEVQYPIEVSQGQGAP